MHIQPGMPEPFIEVLRQYEQFMNADIQNLNDEDVREKIDSVDGKWRYFMRRYGNHDKNFIYMPRQDLLVMIKCL